MRAAFGLVGVVRLDAAALTPAGGDSCAGSRAGGWQTHRNQALGEWGLRTDFAGNTVTLAGVPTGYGFKIDAPAGAATTVRCDNVVTGGAFANVPCARPGPGAVWDRLVTY